MPSYTNGDHAMADGDLLTPSLLSETMLNSSMVQPRHISFSPYLSEPSHFLGHKPDALERFADAALAGFVIFGIFVNSPKVV
jgi:hypothetical protein